MAVAGNNFNQYIRGYIMNKGVTVTKSHQKCVKACTKTEQRVESVIN